MSEFDYLLLPPLTTKPALKNLFDTYFYIGTQYLPFPLSEVIGNVDVAYLGLNNVSSLMKAKPVYIDRDSSPMYYAAYVQKFHHHYLISGQTGEYKYTLRPTQTSSTSIFPSLKPKLCTTLTEFRHGYNQKERRFQVDLLAEEVLIDTTALAKSKKAGVKKFKITPKAAVTYTFAQRKKHQFQSSNDPTLSHNTSRYSEYHHALVLLVTRDGNTYESTKIKDWETALCLLSNSYMLVSRIYQRKTSWLRAVNDYFYLFITLSLGESNQKLTRPYELLKKLAAKLNSEKYRDLHVDENVLISLFSDYSFSSPIWLYEDRKKVWELINKREQVTAYLNKNDTKGARKALLGNFDFKPALAKRLLQYRVYNNNDLFVLKRQLNDRFDSNQIIELWEAMNVPRFVKKNDLSLSYYASSLVKYIKDVVDLIELGFSFRHVINSIHKHPYFSRDVSDIMFMYARLLTLLPDYQIPTRNIAEFHNQLTRSLREATSLSKLKLDRLVAERIDKPYESGYISNQHIDKFEFLLPTTLNQLVDIGNRLENCVGYAGYIEKVCQGKAEIIVVYENNKVIACFELAIINDGATKDKKRLSLVQAKLKHNKSISLNKDLVSATRVWLNNNKIAVSTHDL